MGRIGYRHTPEAIERIREAARRPKPWLSRPLAERLAAKTLADPNTTCLLWVGNTLTNGYGVIVLGGRPKRTDLAHRVAYRLAYGAIPNETPHICHRCDVRRCVNPKHLFAGTQSDNAKDMWQKGRGRTDHLHTPEATKKMVATRRARGSYRSRRGAS